MHIINVGKKLSKNIIGGIKREYQYVSEIMNKNSIHLKYKIKKHKIYYLNLKYMFITNANYIGTRSINLVLKTNNNPNIIDDSASLQNNCTKCIEINPLIEYKIDADTFDIIIQIINCKISKIIVDVIVSEFNI